MSSNPYTEFTNTYSSRKFLLSLVSIILLTGMSLMALWFNGIEAVLPTFVGGLLGVLSIYYGGNITGKFVAGKHIVELGKVTETVATQTVSCPEPPAPAPAKPAAPVTVTTKTTVGSDPDGE